MNLRPLGPQPSGPECRCVRGRPDRPMSAGVWRIWTQWTYRSGLGPPIREGWFIRLASAGEDEAAARALIHRDRHRDPTRPEGTQDGPGNQPRPDARRTVQRSVRGCPPRCSVLTIPLESRDQGGRMDLRRRKNGNELQGRDVRRRRLRPGKPVSRQTARTRITVCLREPVSHACRCDLQSPQSTSSSAPTRNRMSVPRSCQSPITLTYRAHRIAFGTSNGCGPNS